MVKKSTNLSEEGLVKHQVSQIVDYPASACRKGNSEFN
jgi:hypothetical protein